MVIIEIQEINSEILNKFNNGKYYNSYELFGAHFIKCREQKGVRFCLWAPHAKSVSVVGDFNNWNGSEHMMKSHEGHGVWSIFIPKLLQNTIYKYEIITEKGEIILKADPYGFYSEIRPKSASKVHDLNSYLWNDGKWIEERKHISPYISPMLIYEVHAGSWKVKENGNYYNFRELADRLVDYVVDMGYTHIELLPIAEHPLDKSWGYQVTGYFSITSRFGSPEDFMYFVDKCHEKNIGVIVDWVCAHFCKDDQGLRRFDGEALYEHSNILKAENVEWGTCNFDFEKKEVLNFLTSNAFFYFDIFHVDGLRLDAVSSMLYFDHAREDGKFIPNKFGGNENLEAVDFFKDLNSIIFEHFPSALMIAEESTTWPKVTAPIGAGGLGFNYKWNMGWMNDVLGYMELDPLSRKWNHNKITFSFTYTFTENYILCLSHDEVVHGKKSLLSKMSGDYWQKFANIRDLYAYMIIHPGKKLLFMGGEFGQFIEWREDSGLDWLLLDYDMHRKLKHYVKALNKFYIDTTSLWELDHVTEGLEFIDGSDNNNSVVTIMRKGKQEFDFVIAVCNFTPVVRYDYRIGVPFYGIYTEVFNTDSEEFGGSGQLNDNELYAQKIKLHHKTYSLQIKLPPLGTTFIKLKEKIELKDQINLGILR